MTGEVLNNIPIITRETTKFPVEGSYVRIGEGVNVVSGDIADLSGRGIVISNKAVAEIKPVEASRLHREWVDIMNA